MRRLKEQLEARRKYSFEKGQFEKSVIQAKARLLYFPWLAYVVRKSHESETCYYLDLWRQEPQYFILFQENQKIREIPVFLTSVEEVSLKADFEKAIEFCNKNQPSNVDIKTYNSVVEGVFKEAIKYEDIRYCSPIKYYTFSGFVVDLEDATDQEIEQLKPQKVKTDCKPHQNSFIRFFNSLYG